MNEKSDDYLQNDKTIFLFLLKSGVIPNFLLSPLGLLEESQAKVNGKFRRYSKKQIFLMQQISIVSKLTLFLFSYNLVSFHCYINIFRGNDYCAKQRVAW